MGTAPQLFHCNVTIILAVSYNYAVQVDFDCTMYFFGSTDLNHLNFPLELSAFIRPFVEDLNIPSAPSSVDTFLPRWWRSCQILRSKSWRFCLGGSHPRLYHQAE
jgi:hypothetical protein